MKNILKITVFLILLSLALIPVITSSPLDLEQKKENEITLEQQRAERENKKTYLTGKFDLAGREDFIPVPVQNTLNNGTQNKMYLRRETLDAFLEMVEAAEKDKVSLKIVSATRNFDYQRGLWNDKWNGVTIVDGENLSKSFPDGKERFAKILEYSAVPGTSRHHWGTDIDINGVNPPYFNSDKGKREYAWLVKNAASFGFCQTYNQKGESRPTGYNEEKWHWSYLPLARDFTKEYEELVKDEDIQGFDGDEYVPEFNLIKNYVLSINPDCI